MRSTPDRPRRPAKRADEVFELRIRGAEGRETGGASHAGHHSPGCGNQIADPEQVVDGGGEGEHPIDLAPSAKVGLAHRRHRLQPAEEHVAQNTSRRRSAIELSTQGPGGCPAARSRRQLWLRRCSPRKSTPPPTSAAYPGSLPPEMHRSRVFQQPA